MLLQANTAASEVSSSSLALLLLDCGPAISLAATQRGADRLTEILNHMERQMSPAEWIGASLLLAIMLRWILWPSRED